jgi:uncharacterized repeat protein (TIGR02543 family)
LNLSLKAKNKYFAILAAVFLAAVLAVGGLTLSARRPPEAFAYSLEGISDGAMINLAPNECFVTDVLYLQDFFEEDKFVFTIEIYSGSVYQVSSYFELYIVNFWDSGESLFTFYEDSNVGFECDDNSYVITHGGEFYWLEYGEYIWEYEVAFKAGASGAKFWINARGIDSAPVTPPEEDNEGDKGDIDEDGDLSNGVTVVVLATPVLTLTDLSLSWTAVANAGGYEVFYYNLIYVTTSTALDLSSGQIKEAFTGVTMPLKVRAFANVTNGGFSETVYSSFSNSINITYIILDNISVTKVFGGFSWNDVGVPSYLFKIYNGSTLLVTRQVTDSNIDIRELALPVGIILHVELLPEVSNAWYIDPALVSFDFKIIKLGTPTLTKNGNILSWNTIAGAVAYKVWYGSEYFITTAITLNVSTLGLDAGLYTFKVQALADGSELYVQDMSSVLNYGLWIVQATCTVVYANTDLEPAEFEYGLVVEAPVPTKAGFRFIGWFLDVELETEFTTSFITGDMTLYAKWERITLLEYIGNFFSAYWFYCVIGVIVLLVIAGLIKNKARAA